MEGAMVGMSEQFPEFHDRVRFDRETMKGSCLDVIRMMGIERRNATRFFHAIENNYPELFAKFTKIKINGKVSGYFMELSD
ncbi:hypothetical protein [Sicyoidochytrium minutum DNA virus]|nr:hypothetical protein [Sicyoidochytrium minutum DNA virus]